MLQKWGGIERGFFILFCLKDVFFVSLIFALFLMDTSRQCPQKLHLACFLPKNVSFSPLATMITTAPVAKAFKMNTCSHVNQLHKDIADTTSNVPMKPIYVEVRGNREFPCKLLARCQFAQ